VKHINAERYVAEKHEQAILQLQQRILVRGNVDDYQAKTDRVRSIVKERLVSLRQQQVGGQRVQQKLKQTVVNDSEYGFLLSKYQPRANASDSHTLNACEV